jgi:hypothetical protein
MKVSVRSFNVVVVVASFSTYLVYRFIPAVNQVAVEICKFLADGILTEGSCNLGVYRITSPLDAPAAVVQSFSLPPSGHRVASGSGGVRGTRACLFGVSSKTRFSDNVLSFFDQTGPAVRTFRSRT